MKVVIFDQKSSSSGYDQLCENIFTGIFKKNLGKLKCNIMTGLWSCRRAKNNIRTQMRFVRRRRVGVGRGAEDFRTERDILSVWNILIGHSRMVKNDQEWGILEWKPDSKMGNILFQNHKLYLNWPKPNISHFLCGHTIKTRVSTQFRFILVYPDHAEPFRVRVPETLLGDPTVIFRDIQWLRNKSDTLHGFRCGATVWEIFDEC